MQKVQKKTTKKKRRKRRLRPIIKYSLAGLVILFAGSLIFFLLNPFFVKTKTLQVEYQSRFNPYDNIAFVAFGTRSDVSVKGSVDTSEKGDYTLTYSMFDKTVNVNVEVSDKTAPVVTGKDLEADLKAEIRPEDFIRSVTDTQSVTFSFKTEPDFSKAGKQKVEIVAADADGNETVLTQKLILHNDTTAPSFENVADVYEVQQGKELRIEDIRIKDDLDPSPVITLDLESVDTTVPGEYTVTAYAEDRSGNRSEKELTIQVNADPLYGQKVVYLTFDDGPSYNTAKVLDVLKKNNVKATFFVTGNGEAYNDSIKRAYDEGHTIGLHTFSHDYSYVYASEENYFRDLQHISDIVKDITGEESKVIRFPGGSSNTVSKNYNTGIMTRLAEAVRERGYQYFDWNVSSSDATGNNVAVETLVRSAEVDTNADWTDELVILFHDGIQKDTTVEALQTIIDYYKKAGYVFAGLTVDSFPAHHGINN